jgi:predicted nucleotidyltransferase
MNAALAREEEVVLIAALSGVRKYQAWATMLEPVDPVVTTGSRWLKPFRLRWEKRIWKWTDGVPFSAIAGRVNSADAEGRLVTDSHNLQEIDCESGELLCGLIAAVADAEQKARDEADAAKDRFFVAAESESKGVWKGFLSKVSSVGELVFAGHIGSRAYGLNVPSSDVDLMAVVAMSLAALVDTVHPAKLSIRNADGFKPDFVVVDAGHFVSMLLAGDPRCVETLFHAPGSEPIVFESPVWEKLQQLRPAFVTPAFVRKYLSELDGAKGAKKLESRFKAADPAASLAPIIKMAYVLLRQLHLARRAIASVTNPAMPFSPWFEKGSPDHADLMAIRSSPDSAAAEIVSRVVRERDELEVACKRLPPTSEPAPELLAQLSSWIDAIRVRQLATLTVASPWDCISDAPVPGSAIVLPLEIREEIERVGGRLLFAASPLPPGFETKATTTTAAPFAIVYSLPTRSLLSLSPAREPSVAVVAAHEVGRFCQLASTDNPNVYELIASPLTSIVLTTPAFDWLRKHISGLLSKGPIRRALAQSARSHLHPQASSFLSVVASQWGWTPSSELTPFRFVEMHLEALAGTDAARDSLLAQWLHLIRFGQHH